MSCVCLLFTMRYRVARVPILSTTTEDCDRLMKSSMLANNSYAGALVRPRRTRVCQAIILFKPPSRPALSVLITVLDVEASNFTLSFRPFCKCLSPPVQRRNMLRAKSLRPYRHFKIEKTGPLQSLWNWCIFLIFMTQPCLQASESITSSIGTEIVLLNGDCVHIRPLSFSLDVTMLNPLTSIPQSKRPIIFQSLHGGAPWIRLALSMLRHFPCFRIPRTFHTSKSVDLRKTSFSSVLCFGPCHV